MSETNKSQSRCDCFWDFIKLFAFFFSLMLLLLCALRMCHKMKISQISKAALMEKSQRKTGPFNTHIVCLTGDTWELQFSKHPSSERLAANMLLQKKKKKPRGLHSCQCRIVRMKWHANVCPKPLRVDVQWGEGGRAF